MNRVWSAAVAIGLGAAVVLLLALGAMWLTNSGAFSVTTHGSSQSDTTTTTDPNYINIGNGWPAFYEICDSHGNDLVIGDQGGVTVIPQAQECKK